MNTGVPIVKISMRFYTSVGRTHLRSSALNATRKTTVNFFRSSVHPSRAGAVIRRAEFRPVPDARAGTADVSINGETVMLRYALVIPILLAGAISAFLLHAGTASGEDDGTATAQHASRMFMEKLQGVLQQEIRSGGPAGAILVCADTAQVLTAQIGLELGVDIKRVGDRVRNPLNTPDEFEDSVLSGFARRISNGEEPPLRFSEIRTMNGKEELWFMQSIHIQPLCMTCHGSEQTIPADVRMLLQEKYPEDRATGYRPGELRGAIRIIVPLE